MYIAMTLMHYCLVLQANVLEGSDFFRSTGKINVVFAVIAIIFLGLVFSIYRLDKRLNSLENRLNNE
jgi:CcmD family protein